MTSAADAFLYWIDSRGHAEGNAEPIEELLLPGATVQEPFHWPDRPLQQVLEEVWGVTMTRRL
jgi:hypothetical protein